MNLLALLQGFDIPILFHAVAKFIFLPMQIILVMDGVVFSALSSGDGVDADDMSSGLNAIDKGGHDEPISPEESQQPKRCKNSCNNREKESSVTLKERIDPIDHPAGKDHDEKILSQIIRGYDLKECGGGLLHDVSILSGRQVLPAGSIDFPSLCAASILPFRSAALSHRLPRAAGRRSGLHR
jgi:hypothetical protein